MEWFDIFLFLFLMFVEGHYEVAVNFDAQHAVPQFHLRMVSPDEVPKHAPQRLNMYLATQPFKPVPHIMNLPPMLQEDNFLSFESLVTVHKPIMLHTFAASLPAIAHIEFESSVSVDLLVNRLHQAAIWLDSIVAYDGGSHNVARLIVSKDPIAFRDGVLPELDNCDVLFQWQASQSSAPVAHIQQHPVVLAYTKNLEEAPRSMSFRTRFPSHQRRHQEQTVVAASAARDEEDYTMLDLSCLETVTIPEVDGKVPIMFGDFIVFMLWPEQSDTFVKTQVVGFQDDGFSFPFQLLNQEHVQLPADAPIALFDDKTKTLRSQLFPASRFQYMSHF